MPCHHATPYMTGGKNHCGRLVARIHRLQERENQGDHDSAEMRGGRAGAPGRNAEGVRQQNSADMYRTTRGGWKLCTPCQALVDWLGVIDRWCTYIHTYIPMLMSRVVVISHLIFHVVVLCLMWLFYKYVSSDTLPISGQRMFCL